MAGEAFEACVHFPGVLPGKLRDGVNAELIKVPKHSGPNGDEVLKAAGRHKGPFYISLYVRHKLTQNVPHSGGSAQAFFLEEVSDERGSQNGVELADRLGRRSLH